MYERAQPHNLRPTNRDVDTLQNTSDTENDGRASFTFRSDWVVGDIWIFANTVYVFFFFFF